MYTQYMYCIVQRQPSIDMELQSYRQYEQTSHYAGTRTLELEHATGRKTHLLYLWTHKMAKDIAQDEHTLILSK